MSNDLIVRSQQQINNEITAHRLSLPKDYDLASALQFAKFEIEEKGYLKTCTPESIQKSLLHMATMGLNPGFDQCYFIKVYDKLSSRDKLTCRPSYFGEILIAKRLNADIDQINYDTIHKGDKYCTEKDAFGRTYKVIHETEFGSKDEELLGAYCVITFKSGNPPFVLDKTIKEIKRSWTMSKTKDMKVHDQFAAEMAKRTVISATLKPFLRSAFKNNPEIKKSFENAEITEALIESQTQALENAEVEDAEFAEASEGIEDAEEVGTREDLKRAILEILRTERYKNGITYNELIDVYDKSELNNILKRLNDKGIIKKEHRESELYILLNSSEEEQKEEEEQETEADGFPELD